MARYERRRLQAMIDRTAKAAREFHHAQAELNDWCLDVYGVEPADINADEIIDAVMGGGGAAPGMEASAFHAIMKEHAHDQ